MNPFQMLGAIRNPQALLNNVMNNSQFMQNPIAQNAIAMYREGNTDGLKQMAENVCKEKGTTPQQIQQAIMSQMGMQQ